MKELITLKMEQKFDGVEDLYFYLAKNVDFIAEFIEVKIQKPLKLIPFCVVGKEKITERNVLFFASKSEVPENLGELIVLSSTFDADIMVFFVSKAGKFYLQIQNWFQKVCNDDTQLIICEVLF